MSKRSMYESLSRRILREIRGKRTQVEMSRLLGHEYNRWHKWESGQRAMKWRKFHQACRKLRIPLEEIIGAIVGWGMPDTSSGSALFLELRVKFGGLSVPELARNLSLSPQKIHRILSGTQEVDLWVILEAMGELSRLLPFFLERVSPSVQHAKAQDDIRKYSTQKHLESSYPWLCVLEALIEHREYKALKKHRDEFFSERTGIPAQVVRKSLAILLQNGAIERVRGKYRLKLKRVDMEDDDLTKSAALARFWTRMSLQRFHTPDGVPSSRKGWTYRIFPVSAGAREEIRKEIQRFYGRVHQLIAKDEAAAKDGAQVLLLHFYDAAELREVGALAAQFHSHLKD